MIMHSSLSRAPEMLALPFKGLTFVTVSFAVYGSLGFQAANGFVMLPAGPGPLNIVPHLSAGPHNETQHTGLPPRQDSLMENCVSAGLSFIQLSGNFFFFF